MRQVVTRGRLAAVFGALCAIVLIVSAPAFAQSGDVSGSSDHPMVSRYPGAQIVRYKQEKFDSYKLLVGPVKGREATEFESLEGRVTRITYRISKERSSLEVMRNYEDALKSGGFEQLYRCENKDCGGRPFNHAAAVPEQQEQYSDQRFLAAHLARPEGDLYVSLYVVKATNIGGPRKDSVYAQLDVVETKPMDSGLVRVDAEAMARDIGAKGSVTVYGIEFDHDSARIRPDSRPVLEEMAKLLRQNPKLELLVVGHTDNQGTLQYNMDLSRRRAESVVQALVKDFGIAARRLEGHGVGYLAPVALNTAEAGRQKNRRVELVQR